MNLDKILKSSVKKRKESEKKTELYLKKTIESLGGKCYKWMSIRGVPDQICMLPDGLIFFVETKSEGDKLRGQQELRTKEIRELGQRVYKADTKVHVNQIIKREIKRHDKASAESPV